MLEDGGRGVKMWEKGLEFSVEELHSYFHDGREGGGSVWWSWKGTKLIHDEM